MTQTAIENGQEQAQQQEQIDFKMVTFSLGGKDYGIDIMRVKEIAKFAQFTYVPNTAQFVRGVYNLRGDIISIIDMRLFFNLPAEQKAEGQPENGLILRLESNMIGVIVDSIDKVVGIASSHVQPPHPIFGDINVKYISGVAEYEDRLYIILDVDRIFNREEESEEAVGSLERRLAGGIPDPGEMERSQGTASAAVERDDTTPQREVDVQRDFIAEGLKTFSGFSVSPVNDQWFGRRVVSWVEERGAAGREYQLKQVADAESFLAPFLSRFTGRFWLDEYVSALSQYAPASEAAVYNVWNPGCGSGHESYSIAAVLRRRFPGQQIKIWAGDKDLLKISNAPNLVFSSGDIPREWEELTVEGKNGLSFMSEIKDMILFEFSDVLSAATMPKMDLIVARDIVSFQTPEEQDRIMERFDETLKPGGVLILGDNEEVNRPDPWEPVTDAPLSIYIHR